MKNQLQNQTYIVIPLIASYKMQHFQKAERSIICETLFLERTEIEILKYWTESSGH